MTTRTRSLRHSRQPLPRLTGLATAAFTGLCLFTQLPAFAMDINDVVELKKAQVGDEVILAQARAEQADFHLKTEEIKKLKAAGASDTLILGLMKIQTPAPVATTDTVIGATPAPAPAAAPAVIQAPVNQAALELEMLDNPNVDVAVNPSTRTILLAPAGQLGAATEAAPADRQAWQLSAGKRLQVSIPAGTYKVEWVGEETAYAVTLDRTATTKLIFSTTSTKMYDAIYLSIFRGETRVDGGRLHMLEMKPAAFPANAATDQSRYGNGDTSAIARPASISEPPVTTAAYNTGYQDGVAAQAQAQAAAPVQTEVVSRPVYVDQPVYVQRPVYYTSPVYVAPVYTTRYVYHSSCAPTYYAPACTTRYYAPACPRYTNYYSRTSYHSSPVSAGLFIGTSGRSGSFGLGITNHGAAIVLGSRLDHISLGGFFK